MSKPKDDHRISVIWAIRNYPARKKEHDNIHTVSMSAPLSGMPRGSDVSRTTENIATRSMAPAKQREYEAVKRAVDITLAKPGGRMRIELIQRVYWSGKMKPIKYVAPVMYVGLATAYRWHDSFVHLVGEILGYE